MNPMPNLNHQVTTSTFDEIMEGAFTNAAGKVFRQNCGHRPPKHGMRYWGKGGASLFEADYASWQKCIDSVRQQNLSQGAPADTGLPPDSTKGGKTPVDNTVPAPEGMSTGMKIGIAVGVIGLIAVGFVVVTKMTKAKVEAPKLGMAH